MIPPKLCFAHISYSTYTSFQIQVNSGKMLHKRNLMRTQTLKKLIRGNIGLDEIIIIVSYNNPAGPPWPGPESNQSSEMLNVVERRQCRRSS